MQAAWPHFIIALIALLWSGCSIGFKYHVFMGSDMHAAEVPEVLAATTFFHALLVAANGAMAMALSNWSLRGTPGKFELDRGTASLWVKMSMLWVCASLLHIPKRSAGKVCLV